MLVLTRKKSSENNRQRIFIGGGISIEVIDIDHNKVRIGIEAPHDLKISREEILTPQEVKAREASIEEARR